MDVFKYRQFPGVAFQATTVPSQTQTDEKQTTNNSYIGRECMEFKLQFYKKNKEIKPLFVESVYLNGLDLVWKNYQMTVVLHGVQRKRIVNDVLTNG